jgi:hypothetical protein
MSGDAQKLDPFRDILGLDLPADRLEELVGHYGDILSAIARLRELDLAEVHPAVVFRPLRDAGENA